MKNRIFSLCVMIILPFYLVSCGPGQLFGPTLTPTPSMGNIQGKITGKILGTLVIATCAVINTGDKLLILSSEDYQTRVKDDGSFLLENIKPGKWKLCVQNISLAFINVKYSPILDNSHNFLEVEVVPGETKDVGGIAIVEQ